jgi:hypothetical protein
MSESQNPGPAKEGVVLDAEGHTLYAPESASTQGRGPRVFTAGGGRTVQFKVYRGGWWLPIALGVGIPALFVAGMFLFTILMTIGIALVLLRSIFGSARAGRAR